jgi:membrane-associated phospholipid phosphatase
MRSRELAPGSARRRPGRRGDSRSRLGLAAAGLGCLILVVVLGVAVGPRASGPDRDLRRVLRQPLDQRPYGKAIRMLATETGWPHAAAAMALLPVTLAGILLAWELQRRARPASLGRWRWLPLMLLALPAQHLLRVILDRAGPGVPWWSQGTRGAYPSGAALVVALGWAVGVVVVWDLRPRWRPAAITAAALALGLHAAARVATQKHWATDILGSYLLAGGMLLLAAATRGRE